MAAMSTKGPPVADSKEAEILAYRQALEFSIDAGLTELIIEEDNANVMRSLSSQVPIHIARMCLWWCPQPSSWFVLEVYLLYQTGC